MKQYKILKIVFAENIKAAIKNELKADIVEISLNEDVKTPNDQIGFRK